MVMLGVVLSLIGALVLADSALAVGPTISTSFGVSSLALNGTTSLNYTISAPLGSSQASVGFTDTLPRGVVVSTPNGLDNECGGTVSATDASSTVSLSGGSLAAGTICLISLNVTANWAGPKHNSVTVGSSGGTGNTATADLSVLPPPLRERVYWTALAANAISYANLDGSGGGDLNTSGATVSSPAGIAIDLAHNRIYWANSGTDSISYANLDDSGGGGDLYTAGVPLNDPFGVAIDPGTSKIYWPNRGSSGNYADTIAFAYLDGSGGGGTLSTGFAHVTDPDGVALDPGAGKIYWSNAFNGSYVSQASLANDGMGADVSLSPAPAHGVAVDTAAGRIYWATSGIYDIFFANLPSGPATETNFIGGPNPPFPTGVAVDPSAGRIYWGEAGNAIGWENLTGGARNTISSVGPQNGYPVLLKAPVPAAAPTVTGGSTPGSVLSCSSGDWATDLSVSQLYREPQRFAYQWRLDGSDIVGATSSTETASATGNYACVVTASNLVGSAQQTSAPFSVQTAPTGSPGSISTTGQRAAALKKCKKKHGRARKRCKKRARHLPV